MILEINGLSFMTRDGHLSDLSIDRYLNGELDQEIAAQSQAHVDRCEDCASRIDTIRSFDASFPAQWSAAPISQPLPLEPRRLTGEIIPLAERRAARRKRIVRQATVATSALACAACAMLVLGIGTLADSPVSEPRITGQTPVALTEADDSVRIKRASFSFAAYANGEQGTRSVESGDPIHPGERLGFQVYNHDSGYLLIAGIDDRGNHYTCYPQDSDGQAAQLAAHPDGIALDQAIRLDDVLGHERIIALFCPEPFALDDIEQTMATPLEPNDHLPLLRSGCAQQEVLLPKTKPYDAQR